MVTPVNSGVTFADPVRGTEVTFQPPFPPPREDPFQAPVENNVVEAQRRTQERAARRAAEARTQEPARPRFDTPQIGVQFRVLEDLDVTQARVVDRISREVLREVPTSDRLQFRQRFDRVLGQFLDVEV